MNVIKSDWADDGTIKEINATLLPPLTDYIINMTGQDGFESQNNDLPKLIDWNAKSV